MEINSNKSIVIQFYTHVLGQGDIALADSIIHDHYIQHSPTVKSGKAGFMEFLEMLKQLPKPENPAKPFYRFIGEGDLVAVHLSIAFMGQEKAVVDLYRLEDGKLAEHWDASEDIPETSSDSINVVAGPVEIKQRERTGSNKSIIDRYTREVLIGKKDQWETYLSNDLVQHNPDLENGIDPLITYYRSLKVDSVHKIVGEGNFVISQCTGTYKDSPAVIYDIYRLEDALVVEHWSVKQAVPNTMAHDNGMI